MTKIWLRCIPALTLAALAACGRSGPSDADARDAVEKMLVSIGGKAAVEEQRKELDGIKVGKCVEDELGGYRCDFKFQTAAGSDAFGRFKKGENGWTFTPLAPGA